MNPVAVGFLLSDDRDAVRAFLARCGAEGLTPCLVRSGYEVDMPGRIDGLRVRAPIDYLAPADTDRLHEDVLAWLRALPAVRLASGVTLAEWGSDKGNPAPMWGWLGVLAPHVQVCLRLVRLVRSVIAKEQPAAWALLGEGGDLAWQAPLIHHSMSVHGPQATAWTAPLPRPDALARPGWRGWLVAHLPLWLARRRKSRRSALAKLKALSATIEASGPRTGRVMLISRGRRGTQWLDSRARNRPMLIDEYSEGLPDALAEACVRRNARLILLWEGERPTVDGVGYADRWPDHVTELSHTDFGAIGSALRATVHARYERALDRLMREPAMHEAFRLDGVDMLSVDARHIRSLLLNLSVLMTTQAEAWREAMTALRPQAVVAGRLESRPWINLAAAEAGARTASVKLGIGDEMALSLMAVRPDGSHEAFTSPDALLLWGEHQKRHIQARLPENTAVLAALGRLRSDTFVNEAGRTDVAETRLRLGLRPEGRVITWGGTCRTRWGLWPGQKAGGAVMSPENWRACLRALCRVAEQHGGQVLVKPHPADDQAFVARLAEAMGPVCVLAPVTGAIHNLDLLAVTDVFVSSVSSMFAEALLAGAAAVNVWTPEIAMIYETRRFDLYSRIAAPARSAAAMSRVVDRLLSNPDALAAERRRALAALPDLFGKLDGLNGARTAEWVLDFGSAR